MAPADGPFADHGKQHPKHTEDAEKGGRPRTPAHRLRAPFDDLPMSTKSAPLARRLLTLMLVTPPAWTHTLSITRGLEPHNTKVSLQTVGSIGSSSSTRSTAAPSHA